MELLNRPPEELAVLSTATVNRILVWHGLVVQRRRMRPRESYVCWQRPGPMQLWRVDMVGGVMILDPVSGVCCGRRRWSPASMTTAGLCDRLGGGAGHRARFVSLWHPALVQFGVPEEILTDNGKQFTDRFGKGGEVLFDKICRHHAITHRPSRPRRPPPGRSNVFISLCAASCWTGRCRFPRWRRLMRSLSSTTPSGRIRRWTPTGR